MATQALAANGKTISFLWLLYKDVLLLTSFAGAKVYITGRRMEVLENAAKSHDPSGGGQIIP